MKTLYLTFLFMTHWSVTFSQDCFSGKDSLPSFGHVILDSMGDFRIGRIRLGTKLDSVTRWYGFPIRIDSSEGVNGWVKECFYQDFKVVFYGYESGMSAAVICTQSPLFKMPCGVKCGMTLNEVDELLNSKFHQPRTPITTDMGVMVMTGPYDFPSVFLYFRKKCLDKIVVCNE